MVDRRIATAMIILIIILVILMVIILTGDNESALLNPHIQGSIRIPSNL